MTAIYLTLGLAIMGGLFYALTQITARQRRLNAELTRLERLAGEVALNAEALLDRVDERAMRVGELLGRAEALTAGISRARPPEVVALPPTPAVPAREEPVPESQAPPTSLQRYQAMRTSVWSMADKGMDPLAIAQALSIPRGEVLLMLNLRARRASA